MRIYPPESEEALRTRTLLKEWAREGIISAEQHQHLEQEAVAGLRTTNIFLRLVLFFFTVLGVAAAVGLFFWIFLSRPSQHTVGIAFIVFAVIAYVAAESIVRRENLYRFGIEEALAACSAGLLCWGIEALFFGGYLYSTSSHIVGFLVPAVGAIFSVWIWHRFGLWYFFLAAMGFALFVPAHRTASLVAQHVVLALLYALGLIVLAITRRRAGFDHLSQAHSLAEAFLWLGISLDLNLKLSALAPQRLWWVGPAALGPEYPRPFYWLTYVLIWCLPPLILTLGVRRKDRFILAAGAIAALLTFISNKPYLGWPRHTWDPMLLGLLLTGVALFFAAGCLRPGRRPPRLYRRRPVGKRQALARCQPLRPGPAVAAIHGTTPAAHHSRRPIRRRGLRRSRRDRRLLKPRSWLNQRSVAAPALGCPMHAASSHEWHARRPRASPTKPGAPH